MRVEQQGKGIGLIALSAFFFALMSVFVTLAGKMPFFKKALFRNSISRLVVGGVMLARRIPVRVPTGCVALALPPALRYWAGRCPEESAFPCGPCSATRK